MKKNAIWNPIKIKMKDDCASYEFSSGAFSMVILPALEAMTPGVKHTHGLTTIEVISNTIRTDLINIADSSLITVKVSNDNGEEGEAVVHVY